MELSFIVNPASGKGLSVKAIPLLERICIENGITPMVYTTKGPGDAAVIARSIVSQRLGGIIAVGGDGTVLETANGIIGNNVPTGVIPLGTGNDFARSLGIPDGWDNIQRAMEIIIEGRHRAVDAGAMGSSIFLNVASVGFDAEIIRDLPRIKRFVKGKAAYLISVFMKFLTYRDLRLSLEIDGQRLETEVFLTAVCNGSYYGGGMKVNPQGSLHDGLLDLVVIRPVPRYKIPALLSLFIKGRHLDLPYVDVYRCKSVTICTEGASQPVNADGELAAGTPVSFSIIHDAISIFTQK